MNFEFGFGWFSGEPFKVFNAAFFVILPEQKYVCIFDFQVAKFCISLGIVLGNYKRSQ
jgi:hypothetical protein